MKLNYKYIVVLLVLSVILSACSSPGVKKPSVAAAQPDALTSIRVDFPPILDGSDGDLAWQVAPARVLDATVNGIKPFQMTLKSVYDAQNIYILVQYPDMNMDVIRSPWAYNAEKKAWERQDDSFGDEDEFGFYWNVNVPNYQVNGCKDFCHDQDPNNKQMYTSQGTWLDIWQFNGARSAPMGWARDQRLTDNPDADPAGGFVKDAGFETNSGHDDNVQTLDGKDVPLYWKPYSGVGGISVGDALYLLKSEIEAGYAKKIVSVDENGTLTDETGAVVPITARIPGRILSAPAGPSWNDIQARGQWINGVWTVELARKLNTGHDDDIQFDINSTYYFDIYLKTRQTGEIDRQTVPVSKFVFAK
jgi:hypothetical protein